jgi:hypothetical protein
MRRVLLVLLARLLIAVLARVLRLLARTRLRVSGLLLATLGMAGLLLTGLLLLLPGLLLLSRLPRLLLLCRLTRLILLRVTFVHHNSFLAGATLDDPIRAAGLGASSFAFAYSKAILQRGKIAVQNYRRREFEMFKHTEIRHGKSRERSVPIPS